MFLAVGSLCTQCKQYNLILCRLTGFNPFAAPTLYEIYQKNKQCILDFSSQRWKYISEEALNLVKMMTVRNPFQRPSIKHCLKHKWFSISFSCPVILREAIENLKLIPNEY